jgi:hypothetical protein
MEDILKQNFIGKEKRAYILILVLRKIFPQRERYVTFSLLGM